MRRKQMSFAELETVLAWLDVKYMQLDATYSSKAVVGTETLAAQFAMQTVLEWQREIQTEMDTLAQADTP